MSKKDLLSSIAVIVVISIVNLILAIYYAIHKDYINSGVDFICVGIMTYFTIDLIKTYISRNREGE